MELLRILAQNRYIGFLLACLGIAMVVLVFNIDAIRGQPSNDIGPKSLFLIAVTITVVLAVLFYDTRRKFARLNYQSERVAEMADRLTVAIEALNDANADLRQSEERYRGLVETQDALIVRRMADGRLTFVNSTYCEHFALDPGEVEGSRFTPDIYPEDRGIAEELRFGLDTPPYRIRYDQRVLTHDGWRWIAWVDYAIRDERGQTREVQSNGRDVTARKLALQERPFNLIETVEQACELLAARAVERDIAIGVTFAPEVPEFLCGDAGRLRQVILDLGGNAIKFTDRGGVMIAVSVTFKSEAGVVLLFEVKDTCIGIAAEVQDKLFEEFSQVDSGSTRRYGGTGLGLAISRRIVQRMKGQIGVESALDQGSTFWFMIDLALDPTATEPPLAADALAGRNILLCEENATAREIIRCSLTALGATVRDFATAHEAHDALAQAEGNGETTDAALIDGALPQNTITALGAALRNSPAGRDCRLVLLLAVDQHARLEPYRENRFDYYLVRPIRRRTLAQVLTGARDDEGEWLDPRLSTDIATKVEEDTTTAPPVRVLLAEDNRINQLLAEALLSRLGLDTECVENGRQALEAVEKGNFALVLMDVNMPVVDGLQATRNIRALKSAKSAIPIIAMTASAMDEDRQRCAAAGMNDYISKPVEKGELQRLISQWTDIPPIDAKAS